jgi:hypothetical protein
MIESAESTGITWQESLDAARSAAKREGRLLLTYFWAPG